MPVTFETLRQSLTPIEDPELGVSIVELGLLRGAEFKDEGRKVIVYMTLTTPACPLVDELIAQVKRRALRLPGVKAVRVKLVFSPPWDPRVDASEDARAALGIWD